MAIYQLDPQKKEDSLRKIKAIMETTRLSDAEISMSETAVVPEAISSSKSLKKSEPLSEYLAKMHSVGSSSSSKRQNASSSSSSYAFQSHSDEKESQSDSDFVSDEWAMMALNFKITYGQKRLPSKQPTDQDYANLVEFLETSKNEDEKADAGIWLARFIAWYDKNPTMIRTTGRVIKAKSVVHDPDSPKQMKTRKVLPKKKAKVEVQDGDEEEVKFISSE